MLDLNKYVVGGNDKAKKFHSSGHAQLGQGAQIGAAGGQTFQQRLDMMNKQSRTVNAYGHSKLGTQRGQLTAKRYAPPRDDQPDAAKKIPARQAFNARERDIPHQGIRGGASAEQKEGGAAKTSRPAPPPTPFREPPRRGYDPYA